MEGVEQGYAPRTPPALVLLELRQLPYGGTRSSTGEEYEHREIERVS